MAATQIEPPGRLIFIYNADGGIAQGLLDSIHKTLSPATYPCSLCAITYGLFTMDPRWRAWLNGLPFPAVFYHKDDSPFGDVALPVVLIEREAQVETLVSAETLNRLGSVDALIAEIERSLRPPARAPRLTPARDKRPALLPVRHRPPPPPDAG